MGQENRKIFKAPDGSIYQIEEDGSVTKIKSATSRANEQPSKYQISEDGRIFRVEEDGSVTYLGNAEEKSAPHVPSQNNYYQPPKSSNAWVWVLFLVGLAIMVSVIVWVSGSSSYDPYYYNDGCDSTAAYEYDTPVDTARVDDAPSTSYSGSYSTATEPSLQEVYGSGQEDTTVGVYYEEWYYTADGYYTNGVDTVYYYSE